MAPLPRARPCSGPRLCRVPPMCGPSLTRPWPLYVRAGEHGQHCRFCGFESDGVKYPPCADSDEGASDELSSDELSSRFLQLPRMSRGECLTCLDACKGKFCPDVCAGKTAQGDDMTCELDNDCLDNALDPYGGVGCNVRARPYAQRLRPGLRLTLALALAPAPAPDRMLTLICTPTRRASTGSTAASAASSRMASRTRPAPPPATQPPLRPLPKESLPRAKRPRR